MIVSAYDEADRLPATLAALGEAFPGARVLVADDGSRDGRPTWPLAGAGAELVRSPRTIGKGGATTLAAERVLRRRSSPSRRSSCCATATWRESARAPAGARRRRARRGSSTWRSRASRVKVGGGFGFAVGFSRWAIATAHGLELTAPISGQRALRGPVLRGGRPVRPRFGMETGDDHRRRARGLSRGRDRARSRPPRHGQDAARVPAPRPPAQGLRCGWWSRRL